MLVVSPYVTTQRNTLFCEVVHGDGYEICNKILSVETVKYQKFSFERVPKNMRVLSK